MIGIRIAKKPFLITIKQKRWHFEKCKYKIRISMSRDIKVLHIENTDVNIA